MISLLSKNDCKALQMALSKKEKIVLEREYGGYSITVETVPVKNKSVWGQDMILRVRTKEKNMTTVQNFESVEAMKKHAKGT